MQIALIWEKVLTGRRIFDSEGHACFVTFSCFRRRRLLDDKQAKGIVVHFLSVQLKNQGGNCVGFVIMPEHVHALVRFSEQRQLSIFMNQWKRRSSMELKRLNRRVLSAYGEKVDLGGPMWQPKYYVFHMFSEIRAREKLDYMHNNPVRAGLVDNLVDWPYGSARWYLLWAGGGWGGHRGNLVVTLLPPARATKRRCPCHPWDNENI